MVSVGLSMTAGANAEGDGLVAVRAPREIDLAVRPANRLVWLLRLVFRSLQIAFWLGIAVARLPFLRLSRGSWTAALGAAVVFLFTRLGATFIKVGQIMSSRRPGIVRRAYLDEAILRFGARLLSLVPTFALVSPVEAVGEFCEAVNLQLDFRIEADNNRRFRKNSENEPHLVFPTLVEQLCSDRVLTMEFLDGVKEDKIDALGIDRAYIARKGLESVVRMIFQHGFIHADLHPGNVLFLPGNRFAILDLGLVGVLSDHDRRRYALLGYYIVSGLAADMVRWAYEEFDASRVTDRAALDVDLPAADLPAQLSTLLRTPSKVL